MVAAVVICRSPSLAGVVPVNEANKRIFFWPGAIGGLKKDYLSLPCVPAARICRLSRCSEKPDIAPLAVLAARC
jgi:hypothetical protein